MSASGEPSSGLAQQLPRRFGNYTLLESLGRGGMGDVFLARRIGLEGAERLCVIKTVRADLDTDDEYIQRFIDEARITVSLAHPAICHVFDAGRVDEVLYLAMEHISGTTLRDVIEALGAKSEVIPLGHGLWVLLELLDALDYAHHAVHVETGQPLHVVHRDVSPQNVMVSFEGEVKLIDFGLAHSRLKAQETDEDHVMGKIAYMAPEQVQGAVLDGRADQYAAGILAFELLCGERFYGDMERAQVTRLVTTGGYRPPALAKLPGGVVAVIDRALAPERDARFPDCAQMANALRLELTRIDPMQSRAGLRGWAQKTLAAEIAEHRKLLRGLPGSAADNTAKEARETLPLPQVLAEANAQPDSGSGSAQRARVMPVPASLAAPPATASSSSLPSAALPSLSPSGAAGAVPAPVSSLPSAAVTSQPSARAVVAPGTSDSLELPGDTGVHEKLMPAPTLKVVVNGDSALSTDSGAIARDTDELKRPDEAGVGDELGGETAVDLQVPPGVAAAAAAAAATAAAAASKWATARMPTTDPDATQGADDTDTGAAAAAAAGAAGAAAGPVKPQSVQLDRPRAPYVKPPATGEWKAPKLSRGPMGTGAGGGSGASRWLIAGGVVVVAFVVAMLVWMGTR